MNRILKSLLAFIFINVFVNAQTPEYTTKLKEVNERTTWFRQARFGMFIHWGAYAVPARGEWVKSHEKMTTEAYQKYVEAFDPHHYNPTEWANLAKEAGMKYAVMTAKHHDGFCLFDSQYTDYKISHYVPNRDFTREYLDAFRKVGLKVGLYYSLIDWQHKDYPNVGNHPMRDNAEYSKKNYNWDNYLAYMHNQIRELMTSYGKIDILWLDYSFEGYEAEKWKADELVKMIRKYQPDIILNNRLVINHGVSNEAREFEGYGDFLTPEQGVPERKMVDQYGNDIPWESCLTINNGWGYTAGDNEWKSADLIINTLVNCVSKNGNLLLNIGPDSQGNVPIQSVQTLKTVGQWMQTNGESIYNCRDASLPKPDWGYYTQSGNVLYAHWTNPQVSHINLGPSGDQVQEVTVLNTGKPAATAKSWWGNEGKGNFFVNVKQPTYLTFELPDNTDTVFKLVLKE